MRLRQSRAALLALLLALLGHGLLGPCAGTAAAAGRPAPASLAVVVGDLHGTVTQAALTSLVARAHPARSHSGRAHGLDLQAVSADHVVLPGSGWRSTSTSEVAAPVVGAATASRSRAPPTA